MSDDARIKLLGLLILLASARMDRDLDEADEMLDDTRQWLRERGYAR